MNLRGDKSPSSIDTFVSNTPKNALLALFTVPSEGMVLRQLFYRLEFPFAKPPSYYNLYKSIGFSGLCAGSLSRTTYCLTGNFATLIGIEQFGADSTGLAKTTVAKNALVPLFLLSNARQNGNNLSQTLSYIHKGIKDPYVHGSFFLRNLAANSCLLPGFILRDALYQASGERSTTVPTLSGYGLSLVCSAVMNSFLKPYFTGGGIYTFGQRHRLACRFPAIGALMVREAASLGLVFFNSEPVRRVAAREVTVEQERVNKKV